MKESQTVQKWFSRLSPETAKVSQSIFSSFINYLKENGKGTSLLQNVMGKLFSVFPATTASGISTICTALAPQQHAITGWFMYVQELNEIIRILPYTLAGEDKLLDFPIESIINVKPCSLRSVGIKLPAFGIAIELVSTPVLARVG